MASRAAQVRDACVNAITAAWSPTPPDGVEGAWAADIVLDPERGQDRLLTGRRVYVFATSLTQPRLLDRVGKVRRYVVGVLTAERYTDDAGPVPAAWVDDRAAFVEATILGTLANPALKLITDAVGNVRLAFDEEHGIDLICDRALLQTQRTFWSVATIVFQEVI